MKKFLGHAILAVLAAGVLIATVGPLGINPATGEWELLRTILFTVVIYGSMALVTALIFLAIRLINSEE